MWNNFFNDHNFSGFPEISPLISFNKEKKVSEPFYINDYEEFSLDKRNSSFEESVDLKKSYSDYLKQIEGNFNESFEISPKIPEIMQSNEEKEQKKELEEENNINQKNTNCTTEKNGKIILKKINNVEEKKEIFGLKTEKIEILPRIDYAIKAFKVIMSKFLKEYGNKLIKECKFKNELKNSKLFSPSNKYFTGVSNEKENRIFLDFTLEQVFSYPDSEFGKDNRLQLKNKEMIRKMKEIINNFKKIPKEYQELINFFDMTFADAITLFYDSDNFRTYKEDRKTRYLDSQFIKVKGFSLLERNSFIEMLKRSHQ